MADICPKCFGDLHFLHDCESESSSFGFDKKPKNQLAVILIIGPLVGIVLDIALPLPSSLIHSLLLAILGSALTAFGWALTKTQQSRNLRFHLKNLKNYLYTPNTYKIFDRTGRGSVTVPWLGMLAASVAIQLFFFTPGNASYLGGQVSNQIEDASGANLTVECPKYQMYFYNERIECRVRTGVFGITVPARAQLSPFVGTAKIKVSIF
jgi:hypothetical protein